MYKPVKLPYDYSALEPFIDTETMKVHYNTLYMNYIKNLNAEMQKKNYRSVPIKKLIANIDNYSDYIRNNAGGYFNHSLFWKMLKPNKSNNSNLPSGLSKKIINRDFGSYNFFKKMIEEKANLIQEGIKLDVNHQITLQKLEQDTVAAKKVVNGETVDIPPKLTQEEYKKAVAIENTNYEEAKKNLQERKDKNQKDIDDYLKDPFKKQKDEAKKIKEILR